MKTIMNPIARARAAVCITLLAALAAATAIGGCKKKNDEAAKPAGGESAHSPVVSNRIDVPEAVRRNLGITFAKVERRRVAATIRVPGRFELLPSARREYRTVLPAR